MRIVSIVLGVSLAASLTCGCAPVGGGSAGDHQTVLDMIVDARVVAGGLPESARKDAVLARLESAERAARGAQAPETSRAVSTMRWFELFGPEACEVSYFTTLEDDDGDGQFEGLTARVRIEDRFGDPIKALGAFRIETFAYDGYSLDNLGEQMSNWYVSVPDREAVQTYFDSNDRSFRFPLAFARPNSQGRLIVQATYYLPDGSGRKLFGRRLVKAGTPSGR